MSKDLKMTEINGLDVYYYPLTKKQKECNHVWVEIPSSHNGRPFCEICDVEQELWEYLEKKEKLSS